MEQTGSTRKKEHMTFVLNKCNAARGTGYHFHVFFEKLIWGREILSPEPAEIAECIFPVLFHPADLFEDLCKALFPSVVRVSMGF